MVLIAVAAVAAAVVLLAVAFKKGCIRVEVVDEESVSEETSDDYVI